MANMSFLELLAKSVERHWIYPAFSNYLAETYTFADLGKRMMQMRLTLDAIGVKQGDKVALVGRNSAEWAMDFLSILSYGCVAVPILSDFKPASIQYIIDHSNSKVLLATPSILEKLDLKEMPNLLQTLLIENLQVVSAQKEEWSVPDFSDKLFAAKYPNGISFKDLDIYQEQTPDELAMISYTSGTSGFSKGVMLPYRALWGNVRFAIDNLPFFHPGKDIVSILPLAHLYGLSYEMLTEVCCGVHVHFLNKTPSPRVLTEAFARYHPMLIVCVPLVLEKIIRKSIFPKLETQKMKLLTHLPILKNQVYKTIREALVQVLGGNLFEVIIGGAAFSKDVEKFLHKIKFPYTVGYGMTECAPLITYAQWDSFVEGSVGRPIHGMEVRIDSPDPENIVGEIEIKGVNVMLGYYNNEEATRNAFTKDGWLRTGDLGTVDAEGNLYIRGRSKNMILGPSGQNIYPEEIEDQINRMPYVAESLVISRDNKLVALIHPDLDKMKAEGLTQAEVSQLLQQDITTVNQNLDSYCKIASIQVYMDEFEKTPKKSIKRFLYT